MKVKCSGYFNLLKTTKSSYTCFNNFNDDCSYYRKCSNTNYKNLSIKNLFDLLLSLKTMVNKYMLRVDATYAKRKENVK